MSIKITKEKAIKDVEAYSKKIEKSNVETFSKDQILKLLYDVKDEIEHINDTRFIPSEIPESETVKKLKAQNKELTVDRWNLVSKINALEKENNFIKKNGFLLTKEEHTKLCTWWTNHKAQKHPDNNFGVNGGPLTYYFKPTSIGTIATVKCCCGEKFTLTNTNKL